MSNIIILSLLSLGLVTSFSFIYSVKQQFRIVEHSELIGNEKLTTKLVEVGEFHSIEVNDQIKVRLQQGEPSVEISAEENLLDLVMIENNDGTLVIYKHMNNNQYVEQKLPMIVTVSNPDIKTISSRHQSEVAIEGTLKLNELEVFLSQQGNVSGELEVNTLTIRGKQQSNATFFGTCEKLELELQDQVGFMSKNMEVNVADVKISHSANARVYVTGEITGIVNHSATLDIKGNPDTSMLQKSNLANVN